jgi:hypothetical protein
MDQASHWMHDNPAAYTVEALEREIALLERLDRQYGPHPERRKLIVKLTISIQKEDAR